MDSSNYVATIGFFDGVHRGHKFLIDQVKDVARANGMASMVVTFDQHPRQVLHSDYMPQMLSTLSEKTTMIRQAGADRCEVLHFDEDIARLSARDFMGDILKKRLSMGKLVIGYDNRFGHNRTETFDDYTAYGKELGIEVVKAHPFAIDGINVSSSVIRAFLSEGEAELANLCLGYRYALSGRVVDGVKEGRKMGFPTANINMKDITKMIPAAGVYAVVAILENGERHPAMMNIGTRPTFDGTSTTMEVNLLDYSGNLYGSMLRVEFVKRLRSERKFCSENALMRQLEQDKENALKSLSGIITRGNDR